jgi:hypothetical protein
MRPRISKKNMKHYRLLQRVFITCILVHVHLASYYNTQITIKHVAHYIFLLFKHMYHTFTGQDSDSTTTPIGITVKAFLQFFFLIK